MKSLFIHTKSLLNIHLIYLFFYLLLPNHRRKWFSYAAISLSLHVFCLLSLCVSVCFLSSLSIICLQPFILRTSNNPMQITSLMCLRSHQRERWNHCCILGEWGNEDRWNHRWSAPSYLIHQTVPLPCSNSAFIPFCADYLGAFQVLYRQMDSLLHCYTNNLILLILA